MAGEVEVIDVPDCDRLCDYIAQILAYPALPVSTHMLNSLHCYVEDIFSKRGRSGLLRTGAARPQ
jgi:hypothetical protein